MVRWRLDQRAASEARRPARAVASAPSFEVELNALLHAEVPTATASIVLADLRARDAEVEAVRSGFEVVEIDARVDLGRIVGWATRLRSITQGQGRFDVVPGALRPAALDHPLPLDRGRGAPDEEVS